MIKLLIYGVLLYFAYKLFVPKFLQEGRKDQLEADDEEYTDYEEIE